MSDILNGNRVAQDLLKDHSHLFAQYCGPQKRDKRLGHSIEIAHEPFICTIHSATISGHRAPRWDDSATEPFDPFAQNFI
mmetsp:Transcript_2436/g.9183  ORF Transcript_2436/g.9183 Transcript_2436/m.9183 type:complete len:80 (-) Transcript_2436:2676-2915(-)